MIKPILSSNCVTYLHGEKQTNKQKLGKCLKLLPFNVDYM